MLGVALADDASHAVALHNFAVLTDRLHACANFHRRSGTNQNEIKKEGTTHDWPCFRPDPKSNWRRNFNQGDDVASLLELGTTQAPRAARPSRLWRPAPPSPAARPRCNPRPPPQP